MSSAHVVVGLGYGDEGKGSVTDWLCREHGATQVVRFNGGAQAAHNVCTPDGRHHTFAQWGAGTFAGASTYLSRYVKVNPLNLAAEAEHLESVGINDPFAMLTIDPNALIVTPWHRALNRIKETARGANRHGSCGEGIGEAIADSARGVIRIRDLDADDLVFNLANTQRRCRMACMDFLDNYPGQGRYAEQWQQMQQQCPIECRELTDRDLPQQIADLYRALPLDVRTVSFDDRVIFEGAQGVLLDQDHGVEPYRTWSKTTFDNAALLLRDRPFEKVGVMRAYATRHGAGPFPQYEKGLTKHVISSGEHNQTGPWQGDFRCGWHSIPELQRVSKIVGPLDHLVVTCHDHIDGYGLARPNYPQLLQDTIFKAGKLTVSRGPTYCDKPTQLPA